MIAFLSLRVIKLDQIIKEIQKGRIYLGMSKNELQAVLGPPEARKKHIWKYANLEFWWLTGLAGVFNDSIHAMVLD